MKKLKIAIETEKFLGSLDRLSGDFEIFNRPTPSVSELMIQLQIDIETAAEINDILTGNFNPLDYESTRMLINYGPTELGLIHNIDEAMKKHGYLSCGLKMQLNGLNKYQGQHLEYLDRNNRYVATIFYLDDKWILTTMDDMVDEHPEFKDILKPICYEI